MRTALVLLLVLSARDAGAGPFTLNGTQPMLTHSLFNPIACKGCHGDFDAVNRVEPWSLWAGTMMAQASRDPLFWAALDVANHDVPGIGDWCLRCHVPEGWFAGRSEPPGGSVDGCGLIGPLDDPFGDFTGVSCHVCHRMMINPTPPPGQLSVYHENGQLWLDDADCDGFAEPCRRGPYDYTLGGEPPPHAAAYSPYHEASELCSACHNVTSPANNLIDGGIDTGIRFPIERTAREWEQSSFATDASPTPCQGCHMPDATADPVYACIDAANNRTGNLPQHVLAGGNAWIPEVLRLEYPALGLDAELAFTRDAALDMLQNRSATVDVAAPVIIRTGTTVPLSVTVTNLTGHKLPTGYPEGRRMWLHVEARDANDTLLWESGGWDPATGVLDDDPQLKVYEVKHGIWNLHGTGACDDADGGGNPIFHFVRNNCIALDNRIPPDGFSGGADPETRPVGYAYPETFTGSGILAHWDVTPYDVPIPGDAVSPVTFRATLRYQTASKEYVDFLRDESVAHDFPDDCIPRTDGPVGKSRGAFLHDLWTEHGRSAPVDMAASTETREAAAVDSHLCHQARVAKGAPKPALPAGVPIAEETGSYHLDVRGVASLCPPANVGVGLLDPDVHLAAYKVKPAAGEAGPATATVVPVTDALGDLTVVVQTPELLLVSAGAEVGGMPPAPVDPVVDDYVCYKAKPAPWASRLPKGLQITAGDALTSPPMVFDVKKLRRLCFPAATSGAVQSPDALLTCYAVKPAKGQPKVGTQPGVHVNDGLVGATIRDAGKHDVLCLPARRS